MYPYVFPKSNSFLKSLENAMLQKKVKVNLHHEAFSITRKLSEYPTKYGLDSAALDLTKAINGVIAQELVKMLDGKTYEHIVYKDKKLDILNVQTISYDKDIPLIYGNVKLAGNIIWYSGTSESNYRKSKKSGKNSVTFIKVEYSISLAIALCEGEIAGVHSIWINNKRHDIDDYNIRVHNGGEDQMPDPLIEEIIGIGKTVAYRGLAYVVIEDFPIGEFNNKIPNFSFEVRKKDQLQNSDKLESLISAVAIIPGSGEFIYDTIIQNNITISQQSVPINSHAKIDKSNAIVSLDNLKQSLPNVKWISTVVNWFATDLDAGKSQVVPGVEHQEAEFITKPSSWHVAGYNRQSAHLVTQENKRPIYGGTPDDGSIARYLDELKRRGYSIMFYPMIMVDLLEKPWRGTIYANSSNSIENFFDGENGYKKFILHYARLTKGKVDAFIIGSEMRGLTKFKNVSNGFPAVDKLIELAKEVKAILGQGVSVSYAANYDEYHHTDGGWYNLDALWSSENIDFVGINAYFPLTNSIETVANYKEVLKGWDSGEGIEYYLDHDEKKQKLDPQYAWKNIKWWWENIHVNPDKLSSSWIPKSKKIWFTEIGFPSVDCATNQPNVYHDSFDESKLPRHSNGKQDFLAQRIGLFATEMRWKNSEMVENKFIWGWDARPYPYWPNKSDVWSDAFAWAKGHWIQGKLPLLDCASDTVGISSLSEILSDVCIKSGLQNHQFDVSKVYNELIGYYIFHQSSGKNVIESLKQIYDFDVVESGGVLSFVSRGTNDTVHAVDYGDILLNKDGDSTLSIQSVCTDEIFSKICMYYVKQERFFVVTNSSVQNNIVVNKKHKNLNIPIILSEAEAKNILKDMMTRHNLEILLYTFSLPLKYGFLNINDVIEIDHNEQKCLIKLMNIDISWSQKSIKVSGVVDM